VYRLILSSLGAALILAGCTDPALEKRLADLETKVEQLESRVDEVGKAGPTRQGPSDEQEQAAQELARQVQAAAQAGDAEKGKELCSTMASTHRGTRGHRSVRKMCDELQVIGVDAGELEVEKWFVGTTTMTEGSATLLVFWELWCPHCRREVPNIQAMYNNYNSRGLNVVGLTRLTKSATEEGVAEFIQENSITYPMAKEGGAMASRFGVRGIPAAAVVKDGKVVWRGHPARLNTEMIEGWL